MNLSSMNWACLYISVIFKWNVDYVLRKISLPLALTGKDAKSL